ncbi:MAG: hypothetical protein EOO06_00750 [Chitinophagaceae bacterium]|nr:MAG: hypothetical protein EOO06_00750 [Chitinophagaceae bacterium]
MNAQEIQKLSQLDTEGSWGTLQSVLLNPELREASYTTVLLHLLTKCSEERKYFEKQNLILFKELEKDGLITNELLGLKE